MHWITQQLMQSTDEFITWFGLAAASCSQTKYIYEFSAGENSSCCVILEKAILLAIQASYHWYQEVVQVALGGSGVTKEVSGGYSVCPSVTICIIYKNIYHIWTKKCHIKLDTKLSSIPIILMHGAPGAYCGNSAWGLRHMICTAHNSCSEG